MIHTLIRPLRMRHFAPALTAALLVLGTASDAQQRRPAQAARTGTAAQPVTPTQQGGFRRGPANARATLVEYVSYTCPHCSNFERESGAALGAMGRRGLAVEVRPVVTDIVGLAAAALARCGATGRFFDRHNALMMAQPQILAAASANAQAWESVPVGQRLQRIATDTGMYALVAPRGVTRAQGDACLTDVNGLNRIVGISEASVAEGVTGTPMFSVNGTMLQNVHSWAALQPRLDAALGAR